MYYDNAKKLETTSTGIDVTGDIDATGQIGIRFGSERLWHSVFTQHVGMMVLHYNPYRLGFLLIQQMYEVWLAQ